MKLTTSATTTVYESVKHMSETMQYGRTVSATVSVDNVPASKNTFHP